MTEQMLSPAAFWTFIALLAAGWIAGVIWLRFWARRLDGRASAETAAGTFIDDFIAENDDVLRQEALLRRRRSWRRQT